jgi:hypothetical protein
MNVLKSGTLGGRIFFIWESLPGLRPAKGMSFKAFEPS